MNTEQRFASTGSLTYAVPGGAVALRSFSGSAERIEDLAEKLRTWAIDELHAEHVPPTGSAAVRRMLETAAELCGGIVEVADTPDWLEIDGGSLVIEESGEFRILLSPLTSPLRDNFTIAHELGHYVLHYLVAEPRPTGRITIHRYGMGQLETQANRFAAALLMPREAFKEAAAKYRRDTHRLARYFGVSEPAVSVRLEYV